MALPPTRDRVRFLSVSINVSDAVIGLSAKVGFMFGRIVNFPPEHEVSPALSWDITADNL